MIEALPGAEVHPSGALWLPAGRTALIADVHLGYAWALRRRGQLAPPVGGGVETRLRTLLDDLRPETLVVLGDLVHAPRPAPEERAAIEAVVDELRQRTRLLLVKGNHDRGFERDFAHLRIPVAESWQAPGWFAIHGDRWVAPPEGHCLVAGHFHPAVTVRDAAGAGRRLPAVIAYPQMVLLPAFSPLAAGAAPRRTLPHEWRTLAGKTKPTIIVVTGATAARLS